MPKTGFSSEDELQDRALQRVERKDVEVVRDVRNRIATTETGLASLERLLRVEEGPVKITRFVVPRVK